ncbi:PEP-CTERM sorting domain-containing protein [Salinisphaera hydrothermalis]|uniref:PEP motif putative anchor domain protein n=1 Tax=Salinisphaera hydrothermalis (strain C41B8) TaxID=1304275 RepID=A0A084IQU3_SALHC|nr:PEP-CTERM sorting domain-containing protein [Salinisphaera hydrothermalis]KEZ79077.1 PEP motif putative anchor domain protein [Salinisphaera hydrothermalis C41B8]
MQFNHLAATTAAIAALGLSVSASASVINFDQHGAAAPAGSVSYDGNGGPLVGSGISFDEINSDAANSPNTLTCNSCTISITSGANTSEGPSEWDFGANTDPYALTLSGTAMTKDSNKVIASGALFHGSISSATVLNSPSASRLTSIVVGEDDINSGLANYYGLDSSAGFNFTNTDIALGNATFGDNGSFDSGQLQNADVTVEHSVPEPSQFGMFGVGLALVLAGLGFRRKQSGSAA